MKDKRKQKNSSYLQNQILAVTLVFTIFTGSIVAVMTSYLYKHYLQNSLLQTTDINLQFLADSIDNNMDNVERLVRFAQNNSTIVEYVEANSVDNILTLEAFSRLDETYKNIYKSNDVSSGYIHRVIVANARTSKFLQLVDATSSSIVNIALAAPKLPYFDTLLNSRAYDFSTGFVTDPFYTESYAIPILPVIRPIYSQYNSTVKGWIFICITEKLFTDSIQYYSMAEDSELFLTLGSHIYRMSYDGLTELPDTFEIADTMENPALSASAAARYIRNTETGDTHLVITKPLGTDGCYISQTISPGELNSQQTLFATILIIILLLIVILGFILSYLLYRTINVPVLRIRDRLASISTGDFSRDASIEWKHELGDIGRGINDLSESISELLEHRIEDEKQKKDLEYKMLQSQINPHFLYNTLNSIKWMATIQGADGISEMTTALSRLLKSISKGTRRLLPLKEELELLQDYFTIQQYRYGGTIQLEIQVAEESLYRCLIIKFTLQPLVENSIFHGIEPKGQAGHIRISAEYTEKKDVLITVYDDGVGMSEATAQSLLNDTSDNKSEFFREIGVSNVHKRLQYEFGAPYGISIESRPGEYTRMKILLPARFAEGGDINV